MALSRVGEARRSESFTASETLIRLALYVFRTADDRRTGRRASARLLVVRLPCEAFRSRNSGSIWPCQFVKSAKVHDRGLQKPILDALLTQQSETHKEPLRIAQGRPVADDFLENLRIWLEGGSQSDEAVRLSLMKWVPEYQPNPHNTRAQLQMCT